MYNNLFSTNLFHQVIANEITGKPSLDYILRRQFSQEIAIQEQAFEIYNQSQQQLRH